MKGTSRVVELPQGEARGRYTQEMFGSIAPRYDLLNHLLSGGLDRRWRQRAAAAACDTDLSAAPSRERTCPPEPWRRRKLAGTPETRGSSTLATSPVFVDVCTGTGDLAIALARRAPRAHIIACDFSRPMLALAQRKFAAAGLAGRTVLLEADALVLPVADGAADAATCAFGLRNLTDPARGLAEMVRVVRPGGRVAILEFHSPRSLGGLTSAFALYFRRILPRLGAWISGGDRGGYQYLVDSILDFGPPERTVRSLQAAGLASVRVEALTGGIASVFVGVKYHNV
jgi:demethylmenaquinone methyltransferase/2-methoxy-6-polyprenyl-1,4-benzoquinol methylase